MFFSGIEGTVFCIELDKECSTKPEKHFIVGEDISFKFGLVYYYKRQELKEGERIAEWVK